MSVEPNDFDNERLINIRESQEDPIVQYYIVRTDLGMSTGKIGAQIAHGAQMFALRYAQLFIIGDDKSIEYIAPGKSQLVKTAKEWFDGSFRKVVLGGNAKDFEKIKNELDVFLVKDAGLTEVEAGSETVLVTWPQLRSQCPKVLKKLQVLK
jgi:PTH2 family peptidyl-tRNA hydrolase